MNKEQKITTDIKVPNKDLETLKIHFPHCFDKDGNFQLEKFKANLTEKEINFSTESYGLDWLGKSYARLLASDPATTLLKADETHNTKPENANSENLLIKGDNLEVLKHLANAYYEQVKMIYIDPPYNTGNDGFVYNDDRKYTVKELQYLLGIEEEKAKRILDFTNSKSNSHSAWLTFMYPRLYIAKQLLREDGVIFVSIDDNEVAQLRLLMDEIFWEENFVVTMVTNRASEIATENTIQKHEYLLCYTKSDNQFKVTGVPKYTISRGTVGNENQTMPIITFPKGLKCYGIADGTYTETRKISGSNENIENLDPIIVKNETLVNDVRLKARWRSSNDMRNFFNNNCQPTPAKINGVIVEIYFDNDRFNPQIKKATFKKIPSLFLDNKRGSKYLEELKLTDLFDNPKDLNYIKELINIITDKNSIILDFFAGSGTTAHSVMQLNAEDGGNRKFILVQLPELIDPKKSKTAYDFVEKELGVTPPTIFEITKERIIRAAKKINTELDSKIEKLKKELQTEETKLEIKNLEKLKTQNSFKIFETTPIWEDYNFEAEQFDSSQTLFDAGKLTEDDIKALLTTWKTYDGIALTQDLESIDLSGYAAYYGNGRLYLMHKGFTTDCLKALLEKIDTDKHFEPKSIIAFGYHLESKSLREISENVKTYNNKKKSDIDFITRY